MTTITVVQWKDTRWVLTTSQPRNFKIVYPGPRRRLQQRIARRINK